MGNFGDRQRGNQLTVNGENLVSADRQSLDLGDRRLTAFRPPVYDSSPDDRLLQPAHGNLFRI
jgi:hypothetical protein